MEIIIKNLSLLKEKTSFKYKKKIKKFLNLLKLSPEKKMIKRCLQDTLECY